MAEEENEAPETAPENTAEPAESSGEIGANRFLVKERYEIDYAQPLPWLDSNGAKAFRVIDRIDTKRGLFALLCSNATCPRSTILPYVKSIECRSLMKLVEFGIVTWLPEKSRNLALIYKIPYGKVFEGGKTELDIRSSEKFKNTLISLLSAVEALKTTTLPIAPSAPTTFIMPTPKNRNPHRRLCRFFSGLLPAGRLRNDRRHAVHTGRPRQRQRKKRHLCYRRRHDRALPRT